jgi:hypothetical protein
MDIQERIDSRLLWYKEGEVEKNDERSVLETGINNMMMMLSRGVRETFMITVIFL